MSVMVYRYGLSFPTEGAELVREQLRRAHDYRNTLTEIERGRRAALRAAISAHGNVGELELAVQRAVLAEEAAAQAVSRARASTRKRSETPEQVQALKDARAATKSARQALFEYRKQVRGDEALFSRQAEIGEIAHLLAVNARAHCGVYWGTYLLVEAEADAARQAPLYDGAEPNDPHFLPFRGEGRLGVQLQGGLPAAKLFGSDTRLRVEPVDERAWLGERRCERRKGARTTLRMRVGSDERGRSIFAAWPMVMHRPLPEGSVIKWASVHVRRKAWREEWWLTVTVERGDARRTCGEGAVALDVGWRQVGDEVRVAVWRGEGEDGERGELRLSAADVASLRKADDIRAVRDRIFDAERARLAAWLASRSVPVWLHEATLTLSAWKSPARLAALAKRWAEARFPGDEEGFGRRATREEVTLGARGEGLEGWRYCDDHLWTWEVGQRKGALRRRTEVYRRCGAALAQRYGTLVLEDFDLRDVAARPKPDDDPENETARSNRQLVAVSEFRNAVINAFRMRGGDVAKVPAARTTMTCRVCGLVEKFDAAAHVHHTCTGCGTLWDQDENAADVILELWREQQRVAQSAEGARSGGKSSGDAGVQESKWARVQRLRNEKAAAKATAREEVADTAK